MKPRVPDPGGKHVQLNYTNLEVDEDNPSAEDLEYNASKSWCTAQPLMYLGAGISRCNGKVSSGRTIGGNQCWRSWHATPSALWTSSRAARSI